MMRLSMLLAVARAEVRSIRRLVRYWMFAVLSVAITFLIYLYYAGIHGFLSRFSATIGAVTPRYLMAPMGIYLMVIFLLGLIFLAFDVRARDERERISEVLDSRPVSNPELLVGRGIGLVLMALAPVLFLTVLMQTFGSAALLFGWYLGEPVQPHSLVGFVLDALTVFTLWCVVVMLLAVLLRNRLLVALVALILVGVQFWLGFQLPLYLQGVVSLILNFNLVSDLVPSIGTSAAVAKRLALLVMSAGGISLAAALHPRPDGGSRPRRLALGGTLVAVGGLIIGSLAQQATADVDQHATWLAAHQQRQDDPRADLRSLAGTVSIDPGRGVDLDLEIRIQAPPDTQLETLLFTLNPGVTVEEVETSGVKATWTHADGLFEITPSSAVTPGSEVIVTLVATGEPDVRFGYLDSEINVFTGPFIDSNLVLLGTESGIFSPRYVALMPGLRWLPHPGSDVPAGDPRTHPADFFEVELEVEVPADWLVAGPGRRETLAGDGDTARFRFHPGAPVPQVGLLASRFERRAIQAAGVELEVLVHPTHDRNLRFFADAADEIAARAEEIFADAERLGLPYPYGGLTLVESPLTLRGYGGGWRMDTTQTMPGILLLRENSFTTSRFEVEFSDPDSFGEREGGLARAKVEAIERFFENDFSGGNLFLGGSRNFLLFQTSARGSGALAIDFVLEELVSQLLTGKRGYFTPFMFDRQSGLVISETITSIVTGQMDSIVEAVVTAASDRPSVWDRALGSSLADLEPTEDPREALNVLALKSHAIARSILDGLGREKTAALLSELRTRFARGHFDAADLAQVASELDADLEPLLGDWLHEATLPGFITSPVVVERLTDDAQGMPRYQTRVHVRNDEATPGLLRLRYIAGEDPTASSPRWDQTEPVRLAGYQAIEIGIVGSTAPRELWLEPYLSLNRQDVRLTPPRVDSTTRATEAPFLGHRPSTWRPAEGTDIVVDDLDAGFTVETDEADNGVRLGGGLATFFTGAPDMDQGLPEVTGLPSSSAVWSRRQGGAHWGKYRHTTVIIRSGAGKMRAVFTANIPDSGRWRLEYHLPIMNRLTASSSSGPFVQINAQVGLQDLLGTYDLTVISGGDEHPLEFDGAAAQSGWNVLGELDLQAGETKVVVSDRSSGRIVLADAVRWEQVSEGR